MSRWTMSEVVKATGGRLAHGLSDAGISNISIDSRSVSSGECFVAIKGQRHDGHMFIADAVNRGVLGIVAAEEFYSNYSFSAGKTSFVSVRDTQKALGDLGAWRRQRMGIPVVAITGTNGKTTTKEMTAAVLGQSYKVLATAGNFNNLIGVPLTLLRLEDSHAIAVIELGMNAPGEIRELTRITRPNIGVITNIGSGHIEGLRTIDGVMKAKGELFDGMQENGIAVINADDKRVKALGDRFRGRTLRYGIESPDADVAATDVRIQGTGYSFRLTIGQEAAEIRLPLAGRFNIHNALAAATVGYHFNVPVQDIRNALERMEPVEKRMQLIRLANDVTLINDTYNANPESMSQAIETLCALKKDDRGIAVLGDMLELGDYSFEAHQETGKQVARSSADYLFATGDHAHVLTGSAVDAGMKAEQTMAGAHEEIAGALKEIISPHDWLLVKGSRGMAMEKIVDEFVSFYGLKN